MRTSYTVSAQSAGKPLVHHWQTSVGAGRANEGLRASWLEQLKLVVTACGFRYVRFHGIFHDDMFVCRKVKHDSGEGTYEYNWQYIDELFDRLLEIGIRPFVELGFCPQDMASGEETLFWWRGNVSPPRDYAAWAALVTRTVQHWIARYGINEVRQWYFEVWNEPNLSAFWSGTQSQYFALYKETVLAIKQIDCHLRVGGPSSSNFVPDRETVPGEQRASKQLTAQTLRNDTVQWKAVWITDFLAYCQQEQLPVDFVSTHPYPTDLALDIEGNARAFTRNVSATVRDLTHVRDLVRESAYANAEIHLTEWSSSPSSRDFMHDYLPAATFIVKANIEATGLVDTLSYWTFTDVFEENGAGNAAFHGGFGMINFQGIVKPSFHAYRFLHALGDEEIYREQGCIATRDSRTNAVSLLLYHYPDEITTAVPTCDTHEEAWAIQQQGQAQDIRLQIDDLLPGTEFVIEALDEYHGCVLAAWQEMGRPASPTREQIAELKALGWQTRKECVAADPNGTLLINLCLLPWSLILITPR